MLNKIMMYLFGLLVLITLAGYGYVVYLEREIKNTKIELDLAKNSVQDCNALRDTEIANFQAALQTQQAINQIEEDTHEEVTEKFKSRRFTILSSKKHEDNKTECDECPDCPWRFDGIGWVLN